MHAVLLDDSRIYKDFDEIYRTESVHTMPLVTYTEPQAETFNLLQKNVSSSYAVKVFILFQFMFYLLIQHVTFL